MSGGECLLKYMLLACLKAMSLVLGYFSLSVSLSVLLCLFLT